VSETNEKVAADRRALVMRVRLSPYTGAKANVSRRATVGAAPADLYATLLDSRRHTDLVGAATEIGAAMGDPVSLLDGEVTGLLMEAMPDRHIVVAVRRRWDGWPEKHYSTVTFMLRADGGGTTVVVFEQDVPADMADAVGEHWQRSYIDRLTAAYPTPA
jgi:activator of HSP90 ATPase